jgi:hypothetical protein
MHRRQFFFVLAASAVAAGLKLPWAPAAEASDTEFAIEVYHHIMTVGKFEIQGMTEIGHGDNWVAYMRDIHNGRTSLRASSD